MPQPTDKREPKLPWPRTKRTTNDLLIAILEHVQRNRGHRAFKGLLLGIEAQGMFYKLHQRYPILKPLMFSNSGPAPYSRELDEANSDLVVGGLVGSWNAFDSVIRVNLSTYYSEYIEQMFTEEELNEIKKIAAELAEKFYKPIVPFP